MNTLFEAGFPAGITKSISQIAEHIGAARRVLVVTGAGISTESGIPDFRSPTGIWSKLDPEEFRLELVLQNQKTRAALWMDPVLSGRGEYAPNAGHFAIAAWQSPVREVVVATQNVDGLHQKAGSRQVLELHGSTARISCRTCGASANRAQVLSRVEQGDLDPRCGCGGILLPEAVFFGQPLDDSLMGAAKRAAAHADVCVVAGSSLEVFPAAGLPRIAAAMGAYSAVVNNTPTEFDGMAAVVVRGSCGDNLAAISALVD